MKQGDAWYPRAPRRFIDGCRSAKLTSRQWAIYGLVLDLIYEGGGETPNDPKHIAGHFPDVGTASARKEISHLISVGKLADEGGYLTQELAKNVAKTQENLRKTRQETGKKGGISSGFSRRRAKEINSLSEANGSASAEQIREEEIREEKETSKDVSKKKLARRLSDDWELPSEWFDWAEAKGLHFEAIMHQAERFKNYWLAKGGSDAAKMDWFRTWQNWVTSPINMKGNGNGKQSTFTAALGSILGVEGGDHRGDAGEILDGRIGYAGETPDYH